MDVPSAFCLLYTHSFLEEPAQEPEGECEYGEEEAFVGTVPEVLEVAGVHVEQQEEYGQVPDHGIMFFNPKYQGTYADDGVAGHPPEEVYLSYLLPFFPVGRIAKYGYQPAGEQEKQPGAGPGDIFYAFVMFVPIEGSVYAHHEQGQQHHAAGQVHAPEVGLAMTDEVSELDVCRNEAYEHGGP